MKETIGKVTINTKKGKESEKVKEYREKEKEAHGPNHNCKQKQV